MRDAAVLGVVAEELGELVAEVVFVGGRVTELLLTDPASESVRATYDVDMVVASATRTEHSAFEDRLRSQAFKHDTRDGAPVCRWISPSGLVADFMPADSSILGFANPWYARVLERAESVTLASGHRIRIPPAVLFVATKWAAHFDRGADDTMASRDAEDVVAVFAGRPEIVAEIQEADAELRDFIATACTRFLDDPRADYLIAGALNDARLVPGILEVVRNRLQEVASLAE